MRLLRKAFLFERALYGELCRAAYASTLEFLEEHFPRLDGAVPAMVVSPQSHGSLLNFHPHWHAIVSLGVFDREGRFQGAPEDLDFSPLEGLFRQQTFKVMLEKEATSKERVQMLRSWKDTGSSPRGDRGGRTLHVDASRRVALEDRAGLESLLVTMERGPVSLERTQPPRSRLSLRSRAPRGPSGPALGADRFAVPGPSELFDFVLPPRSDSAFSVASQPPWLKGPPARGPPSPGASLPGDDDGPIDSGPPDEADLQDPGVPENTWA